MSTKPLIESPRVRSAVVAVLMLLMLGLSLVGAWAVSRSRAVSPSSLSQPSSWPRGAPFFKHVQIDDLSFSLPMGWARQPRDESQGHDPRQALVWVDTSQPTRRLSVTRTVVPVQTNPAKVLESAMATFLGAKRSGVLKMLKQPIGLRFSTFVAMEVAGVTEAQPGKQIEPHIVSVLSPDRKHYWVFYLTDRIPYQSGKEMDTFARSAMVKDDRLMLEILRSVALEQKP